ncbi:MAG TPA: proline--tRNA ligase [Solirubrobacteraceae bacterium]|jgi:prolyl-tRNA synthetase|nr:proline--tRNA ligase [Solirubrobacteraceae bacterium]
MTRLSRYFLPTEKQPPADAEALSHKLMVRAGLIRQLGAGMWTWLPAGWRVHENAARIVREELDRIGSHEMLMPVLNPAELWQRSGRYSIDELFKLKDRRGADLVLAMTHEEVVTTHVAPAVRSYRDLPLFLYHIQTKERDEPRPRAGVLRTREFIMKDAYTFDRDREALDESYERHREAYDRIFDRAGLEWYRVESDVGMMGGFGAHEYMAPCPAGENDVALAPGYAANVEVASAEAQPVELPEGLPAPEEVSTPGLTTVQEVAGRLNVPAGALLKAFPVMVEDRGLLLVVVRGDHRVNEIKLTNTLGAPFRPAREEEFAERIGPGGYIGPVGIDVAILLDDAVQPGAYIAGANRDDAHLRGVEPGRDFPFKRGDVRRVEPGDTVNGHPIRIEPAIEVGNIFKLGTRFSEPLNATYLDESGTPQLIWMGSYGIGPARITAAAVEQFADEAGISWPRSIAPFDIHLVGLGKEDSEERRLAEGLYGELEETGLRVLYDDRDLGPGEKFADAELLGVPLRLTVGRRTLSSGEIEAQVRRGRETRTLPLEGAAEAAAELWRTLP